MKKYVALITALILICTLFAGCKKKESHAPVEGNTLRFTNLVEDMKALNGQKVTVTGFMSTSFSAENGFFYLMKAPNQDTPFSEDNSVHLADTLAVHMKYGTELKFTDSLITVEGTLVFEDCADIKGYTYSYYIKNATFTTADKEQIPDNVKSWQALHDSGLTAEISKMYDYLTFLCKWPTLTSVVNGKTAYLTPYMALYNIETEDAPFNYGCREGYFDSLIAEIKAVSDTDYSELVANIEKAKSLADKALSALKNGEYSLVDEYSGILSNGSGQYILNSSEDILNGYNSLYSEYNAWLNSQSL